MDTPETGLEAVKKALDPKRGTGLTAISRALGGSPGVSAIRGWKQIPAEYCLRLEAASGVSRYRQRPDIYGADPKEQKNGL